MRLTSHQLALACAGAAEEKKARNITIMNLQGVSLIADYFVICSGSNSTQVKAIAESIDEKLSEKGKNPLNREGFNDARWILLDFGAVVVHIFQEEEREYYNLERLWGDAEISYFGEQV